MTERTDWATCPKETNRVQTWDEMTWDERIADARRRGVPEEKIQALLASRDHVRAAFAMSDRLEKEKGRIQQRTAESVELAERATYAQQDLDRAERKARPVYERAVAPYRAIVADIAKRRAEVAAELEAAKAALPALQDAEEQAWTQIGRTA